MAGNGAQIIGRVNPDLSVKVYNALDLGNNVGTLLNLTILLCCACTPRIRNRLSSGPGDIGHDQAARGAISILQ